MKKAIATIGLIVGAALTVLIAGALAAHAQLPSVAPFRTNQINTTLFVGENPYTTIQSAVSKACSLPTKILVVVPAGAAPPDTIGTAIGCTMAYVLDQRAIPATSYSWNGSAYVLQSGSGGNPGGSVNAIQFNNSPVFGGAQVTIDMPADPTGGSILTPKMHNIISTSVVNPYWTNNATFPQQIPRANFYLSDYQLSNSDFYATSVNVLSYFGTNRYSLASAGVFAPDMAVRYDKIYSYSPNQIGGAHNLQILNLSHGDTVGHTDTVTARGCTEGFEECLERNRQFYGFGWYSPHGPITIGATDYMHHYSVSVVPTNQGNTFGEDNYLVNETKKFVPAGNVTAIGTSTLLGSHFAALTVDATLQASLNTKFGSTLHVAQVVAGADEQKYNNACPSTVIGSWSPIVPYNPTAPDGTGMKTQNQCVTTSGDISSLGAGSVVCIWGDHANNECAYVVSKADSTHLVVSLNHQHDPGEYIVWGSGVGQAVSSPHSYIPRRTLDSGSNLQEEDVIYSMPMIGWDSTNSQIILWPNYSAQGNAETKLFIYNNNTPFIPMTVTGTIASGAFTSLTVTPGSNYQSSTGGGLMGVFPPPSLSFHCTLSPTYTWAPDSTVNVSTYVISMTSGGSGCTDNVVTVNSTYANPVWIYPSLRLFHVRNLSLPANTLPGQQVNGGNMLVDAIPNLADFANGDTVRQQMMVNQWATGNEQLASSPATEFSSRFGPHRTMQWMFPQYQLGTAGIDYTANATPGWYYWSDAAHNYMPTDDPTANPLLGRGNLSFAYGLGGSNYGWMHVTQPPYSKNMAGKIMGGTLIQVDCTTPGQEGEGAHGPCHDRNIYPKYRALANYGIPSFNYIDFDANTGTVDIGPLATIAGKNICKVDPATGAAIDCPAINDYTITLTAAPFSPTNFSFYQIGSIPVALNNSNPLVNVYYVPKSCNVKNIDYTETLVTGALPSSEQPQYTIFQNGTTPVDSPVNMNWSIAGMNHLNRPGLNWPLAAGDRLTFQVLDPGWTTPPSGTIAVTAVLYCQVP